MPRAKQFDQVEKIKIKMWSDLGVPFKDIAEQLGRNTAACHKVAASLKDLSPSASPPLAKKRSGRPRLTDMRADEWLRRAVMAKPFMTAKEVKAQVDGWQGVSVRRIQSVLKERLLLPSRRAAAKPLLTLAMAQKWLRFAKKYVRWSCKDWEDVMFSDESTFRLINPRAQMVRRPKSMSRFLNRFTVKTVKHPPSIMVWACFSGKMGRASLYFLPANLTMNSERYLEVLESKLFPYMELHKVGHFLQDGAPCHKSKRVMGVLKEKPFTVIDWPGNSPDLNPIENVWSIMKRKLKANYTIKNLHDLVHAIKMMWTIDMPRQLFTKLAHSMPKRLKKVIKNHGQMTKY